MYTISAFIMKDVPENSEFWVINQRFIGMNHCLLSGTLKIHHDYNLNLDDHFNTQQCDLQFFMGVC